MKMKFMARLAGLGVLFMAVTSAPVLAQTAGSNGEATARQLAAERNALMEILNDANTPAEKKGTIQVLLEWNARGVTIAEVKKMQTQPPPVAAITPPPPVNNLAEAEAAPMPVNVNVGGGNMLQNFSKGHDAAASSRTAASLGLVKAQQEMDSVTRESEAKQRDAQNIRNQAGASALAQRQQDAASAASQQAAGSIGNMLSDSLVQSVQQGAQAAGQAIGGGAVGRMSGAIGQAASGGGTPAGGAVGGAVSAGANAAAGQIFGGDTGGTTGGPAANSAPVAADSSAMGAFKSATPAPVSAERRVVNNSGAQDVVKERKVLSSNPADAARPYDKMIRPRPTYYETDVGGRTPPAPEIIKVDDRVPHEIKGVIR
ncbi:MAG: hypothetical protein NTY53_17265 [Kiritimatiellaeota bacterium]|nr:hypothetical protein [Kiritimatiellota bacterium]